ncbi:uncharacterized protein (TIGR00369 family) [Phenylobacterium haematophilum]|uniref:Medium/long-chain acyl-CoA thioesterase YigI n=1 Tax=Phenylobacterium haematophilum TaxID=98513 RepID=A0A839ZZL5_9CAUL|nr:PaaI family thioesterase [Phenylobacterium haematophilum]MBB3890612.1 uncharacterized protein (TIGR00369 family) [Phenylobacterium haematophilum]
MIDEATALWDRGLKAFDGQAFSAFLGARLISLAAEGAEIRLSVRPELLQQDGFVHGGVLAYLADNALTFAGGAALGGAVVTVEIKVNYVRPAVGLELVARAHAVSGGRTTAVARCDIHIVDEGAERLCAVAQGTVARMREPAVPSDRP